MSDGCSCLSSNRHWVAARLQASVLLRTWDTEMNAATYSRESALNRKAYENLREHIRRAYSGQYVALANGRLIGAGSTFDSARALVDQLDPAPEYFLVFPADAEPDFGLVLDLSGSA